MIQKIYPASEAHYLCDVCSEAITNPLCPSCLSLEIKAWLTLYPDLKRKITPFMNNYLKKIEDKAFESTQCIKCNSNKTAVCPYCFTEFVLRKLESINAPQYVLKEFFEFFNFDLEHTGYSQEHISNIGGKIWHKMNLS